MNDQAGTLRKLVRNRRTMQLSDLRKISPIRVYSITSGKGGVGKTNLVANLAVALGRMNKRVLVLDADLGLANIDVLFGIAPKYNINDVLTGQRRLREIIVEGPEHIRILPATSGNQDLTDIDDNQLLILSQQMDEIAEDIDILLIDTAAGISSNVMQFNTAAQEILVVVTPEPTSITDAYAVMKVLHQNYGVARFQLVVNMVENSVQAKDIYANLLNATDRYLDISLSYLGHILTDQKLRRAVLKQRPVLDIFPTTIASRCLETLADDLLRMPINPSCAGNSGFFWSRLLANYYL